MRAASTPSRGFLLGCGLALLGLAVASLAIASREWFSRDDFAFLAHVQSEGFSWRDSFLPLESRFWPFYRPLGMETYFRLCFGLFGASATGYFAVSLAFHFASGGLVHAIARQLAFDPRAAWVAALLAVSRPAALGEIFYGSVFHFVLSVFLTLLSVQCFLAGVGGRAGGWRARGRRAASVAALGLALLCNEVNAVVPALLACAGLALPAPSRPAARRVLLEVLPHLLLVLVYLGFRFLLLPAGSASPVYTPLPGAHVVGNLGTLLADGFGGTAAAALTLAVGAALVTSVLRSPGGRAEVAQLATRGALLLVWACIALGPFALLPFPQERYALLASAPAALFSGALVDLAWRRFGARSPSVTEAALVAVVLAAVPYGVLLERFQDPLGAQPLRLLRAVEARRAALPERARLVLLYGGSQLAPADRALPFRYLAYNGAVLQAVYPESELSLRFHDLSQRPPRSVIRPGAVYLQLSPGLEVEDADPELLDRELLRGIEPTRR